MTYIVNCDKCNEGIMKTIGSNQNGKIYICDKCNNIKFNFHERTETE